jgi:cytochrome c oxidase cbb3-type subunit 4
MSEAIDLNTLSTVFMFVAFIGIVGFAVSRRRRADFEEAAQVPFLDDQPAAGGPAGEKQ